MMKIIIHGHGGHLCAASSGQFWEVGETIEEAIGRLVRLHSGDFGINIDIMPCSTTAYERSGYYFCPICYAVLDYTPCDIQIRKCPNNHYTETYSQYHAEKEINGQIFYIDEFDDNKSKILEAINKAKEDWWQR